MVKSKINAVKKAKSVGDKVFIGLVLFLLYLPILWLIIFSFTDTKSIAKWNGFSLNAFVELFKDDNILQALMNTAIIAVVASLAATILGTLAALGLNSMRNKKLKSAYTYTNQIPLVNSEIVTAISLMLLFGMFRSLIPSSSTVDMVNVIFAHIAFCTPYVVLNVLPRIKQSDNKLYEAALDLGCTPAQALRKVVIPDIMPGIIMGFVMSITISIDDFVITNFTIDGFETLSTLIYNNASGKNPLPPKFRALSSLIFVFILMLMIFMNRTPKDKKIKKIVKYKKSLTKGAKQ